MSRQVFSSSEISQRPSQESKVTSTPRTMSPALTQSPSISSIGTEAPMEVDSDMNNSLLEESRVETEESLVLSDNDDGEPPQRGARRVKAVQWPAFYRSLKPENKDSLFFRLVAQQTDLDRIVVALVNRYINNAQEGVVEILQLFVDLCGYKKLKVAEHYNFQDRDSEGFVRRMTRDFIGAEADLKNSGKFVFMKPSRFEGVIDQIISSFLKEFVVKSYESRLLFDDTFRNHVFDFLNYMAFSPFICVRVTGIILVIKFLTALVKLAHQRFLLDSLESSPSSQSMPFSEKCTEIGNCLDFLYMIFDKNCLIPCPKCFIVKVKCAQEMCEWMKVFPDMFIFKRKSLGRLLKLVVDENPQVRISALSTCEELIKDQSVANEMTEKMELFLKVVSGRFVDVDFKVAAKAIGIFTEVVKTFPNLVTKTYQMTIVNRMFEPYIVTAKAAGNFLAAYLQSRHADSEQILLHAVKIVYLRKEFAERLPFYLESIVPFLPQLQHWDLIVNTLLNDQHPLVMRKRLLIVLNECVRFWSTGKFSKNRPTMLEERVDNENHNETIVNVIVSNFHKLIMEFQTDKTCLRQITQMLSFLNCDRELLENLEEHLTTNDPVFNLLRDLFNTSTDKAFLEDITNVFLVFYEKNEHAQIVLESIKTQAANSLLNDLNQLSPDSNRSLLIRLRETSMKLSVLFAKFSLTNLLRWQDIFGVWDGHNFKAFAYLVVCCKWHLVWSFRHLIRASTSNNENGDNFMYINCKDFVYGCLDLIRKGRRSLEAFLVFEELCDLYANFERELKRKRQFSHFVIHISEDEHCEILVDFVVQLVIENTKLQLEQRRKYLCRFVDIVNLGILPVECFARILRYYDSHHAEFGSILTSVLQDLHISHPALPLLVLHTLTTVYGSILEKHNLVEIRSDEAKHLKQLAKRLAMIKEMKFSNVLTKFLNMSLTFALRVEKNFPFLYFVQYFAKLLTEAGRSEMYDLFKKEVPTQHKNNDFVLLFAGILKPPH